MSPAKPAATSTDAASMAAPPIHASRVGESAPPKKSAHTRSAQATTNVAAATGASPRSRNESAGIVRDATTVYKPLTAR